MTTKKKTRAVGRPTGSDNSRAIILAEALKAFAAAGYSSTSLRAVAKNAGVDPSTVIHYFKTKEGLFEAVIADLVEATAKLPEALADGVSGEQLVRTYLGIWDNPKAGAAMSAIMRSVMESESAMQMFVKTVTLRLRDAARASTKNELDAELVLVHLIGLGLGRHILHLPEVSQKTTDQIAQRVGPVLDQYLKDNTG